MEVSAPSSVPSTPFGRFEAASLEPLNARLTAVFIDYLSAGGGNRTHTPLAGPRILSPVRLPVPPPRHLMSAPIVSTIYAERGWASNDPALNGEIEGDAPIRSRAGLYGVKFM